MKGWKLIKLVNSLNENRNPLKLWRVIQKDDNSKKFIFRKIQLVAHPDFFHILFIKLYMPSRIYNQIYDIEQICHETPLIHIRIYNINKNK